MFEVVYFDDRARVCRTIYVSRDRDDAVNVARTTALEEWRDGIAVYDHSVSRSERSIYSR